LNIQRVGPEKPSRKFLNGDITNINRKNIPKSKTFWNNFLIFSYPSEKNKESNIFILEPEKKNDHLLHCATMDHLIQNRIRLEQILANPKFKNYTPGAPTDKLYIKNLSKNVTIEDFYWVYGRHFPDDKVMKRDLEIQIMTGRMKGQAFLIFPTVAIAKAALEDSNGYLLKEKPMIVSFARSVGHTDEKMDDDNLPKTNNVPPEDPQ